MKIEAFIFVICVCMLYTHVCVCVYVHYTHVYVCMYGFGGVTDLDERMNEN